MRSSDCFMPIETMAFVIEPFFGIQLSIDANCNGVVVFEAKTNELEQHYIRDFGARPVASLYPGGPKTFMIADQAAKDIFSSYLF